MSETGRSRPEGPRARRRDVGDRGRAVVVSFVALMVVASGCQNPFAGDGAARFNVPPERLREIEMLELTPAPAEVSAKAPEPPPEQIDLTIEQCRAMTLRNNLALQVQLISPTIASHSVSEAEARFEALLLANASLSKSDTPTASTLSGSQTETRSGDVGVQIPLRTGGSITLDVPMSRYETDNAFSTLNPSNAAAFSASFSQPLLRGAGVRANTYAIRVAGYQQQEVEARTKLEVIRVIAAVDRVYWRLFAARQAQLVRKQEYDLAQAQLERARRQVAAGEVAEVEIIRAESGVADRLESIIIAENDVRDRQRDLKRIINKPGLDMLSPTVVRTSTVPTADRYDLSPQRLADAAVANRMEMLELELQLAQDAGAIEFERNAALPLVALSYTYNVNGLGATLADAFDLVAEKRFEDHRLGLQVQVPLGNEAALSRVRRAIAARLQRLATRRQRRLQIRQEVLNAVDQIEANWQRLVASRQRTVLSQRSLDAEVRQYELGLSTSNDVLDAQARLADAQYAEIRALTECQIARVDLAFATGTLLGAAKIRWEPSTGAGEVRGPESVVRSPENRQTGSKSTAPNPRLRTPDPGPRTSSPLGPSAPSEVATPCPTTNTKR